MKCSYEQYDLKEILGEASRALARLDANRLEDMTRRCEALVCGSDTEPEAKRPPMLAESAMDNEITTFARVVEATRINLQVLRRLTEIEAGQLEYSFATAGRNRAKRNEHGHD